jgi:hypothetical protein
MKNRILSLLSLMFTLMSPMIASAAVENKIDWPRFLSRHDLVW